MLLTPIRLTDGRLLFTLPTGPYYLSPSDFGYHKVLHSLPISQADLRAFTAIPPLPDGVFYAYVDDTHLHVTNINGTTVSHYDLVNGAFVACSSVEALPIAGVFTSLDEVRDYFPHFFI